MPPMFSAIVDLMVSMAVGREESTLVLDETGLNDRNKGEGRCNGE